MTTQFVVVNIHCLIAQLIVTQQHKHSILGCRQHTLSNPIASSLASRVCISSYLVVVTRVVAYCNCIGTALAMYSITP